MIRPWTGVLLAAAIPVTAWSGGDGIVSGTFTSEGARRTYAVYAPPAAEGAGPRPLLIALHGSGGNGRDMVRLWQDLARAEGLIVAGPDARDPRRWQPPEDGPVLLRDLVEAVAPRGIDRRRVYLFGHSAGAVFALYMAPLEAGFFAAAAAHAGAYTGEADLGFLAAPGRKIPILIRAGTEDRLFAPAAVRDTARALERAGFPVTTDIRPGAGHRYEPAREINRQAWEFLKEHRLDADPVFVPVEFGNAR